jgi:hypothetical protein
MSKSLELSDSVFAALEEAATASGTTPAEWIAATLPASPARADDESAPPGTLAERLLGLVGLIRSRRGDSSERCDGMSADVGEGPGDPLAGAHQRMILVSEDVFHDLEVEAHALGTTPAEWIAARLPDRSPPATEPNGGTHPPRTLADEFAGRVGRFSSGRSDLSERVSELFADGMVEKHREGRL